MSIHVEIYQYKVFEKIPSIPDFQFGQKNLEKFEEINFNI